MRMNTALRLSHNTDFRAVAALILLWLLFFWRLFTPIASDQASLAKGDFSGQFVAFGALSVSAHVSRRNPALESLQQRRPALHRRYPGRRLLSAALADHRPQRARRRLELQQLATGDDAPCAFIQPADVPLCPAADAVQFAQPAGRFLLRGDHWLLRLHDRLPPAAAGRVGSGDLAAPGGAGRPGSDAPRSAGAAFRRAGGL